MTRRLSTRRLRLQNFKGGDCVDKEFTAEELEKEIVMQGDYIDKLEKYNDTLIEENHILKSQLNRKSASMQRSAKEIIHK